MKLLVAIAFVIFVSILIFGNFEPGTGTAKSPEKPSIEILSISGIENHLAMDLYRYSYIFEANNPHNRTISFSSDVRLLNRGGYILWRSGEPYQTLPPGKDIFRGSFIIPSSLLEEVSEIEVVCERIRFK
jgi:hypothetical protein